MTGAARVEVQGLDRLRASMRAAGIDVRDLRDLNRRAATVASPWVRAAAPRGPDVGGHIASTVRAGGSGRAGVVRIGNKRMPYAGVINFGWPARNIKANPWALRGASNSERSWMSVYQEGIESILSRIEGA